MKLGISANLTVTADGEPGIPAEPTSVYGAPPFGDVRDTLLALPWHHGGNGYVRSDIFPVRFEIARILRPRSIFEIGALTGYALVTLVLGSTAGGGRVSDVGWIDNERHTPDSNRLAAENLQSLDIEVAPRLSFETADSYYGCLDAVVDVTWDLVAVDGDHGYESTVRDLLSAFRPLDPVVLVDDTLAHDDAGRAADDVARWLNLASFYVPTVNGLTVLGLDRREIADLRAALGLAGYQTLDERQRP